MLDILYKNAATLARHQAAPRLAERERFTRIAERRALTVFCRQLNRASQLQRSRSK